MDEVTIDVEDRGAILLRVNDVFVPDFFVEGASHSGFLAVERILFAAGFQTLLRGCGVFPGGRIFVGAATAHRHFPTSFGENGQYPAIYGRLSLYLI